MWLTLDILNRLSWVVRSLFVQVNRFTIRQQCSHCGTVEGGGLLLGAGERAGVLLLGSSRGAMRAGRGKADPPSASISGSRRPGSIRASLLLSSLRRAPGPRLLALLGAGPGAGAGAGAGPGAGAGAAAAGGGGGFRAPEPFLS